MMSKGKENKPHIGIFGRRNNGKSSLINVLAGQDVAIVSENPGTTTDPVKKSIEIEGVGPAIVIDTAGLDDVGELGELRIKKSREVIKTVDLAILIITGGNYDEFEKKLVQEFYKFELPFFIVHNKSDQFASADRLKKIKEAAAVDLLKFSAITGEGREDLFRMIRKNMPETAYKKKSLLGDLLSYGDLVMLITPIDIEAPEGRMILPQVQAIRDILDNDCVAIVLKEREVDVFLKNTKVKPKLAITDSQVFLKADASVPDDIPLTGFSVLLAYHKGNFDHYLKGTPKINDLKDGDRVLLLESCSHHVSCDDIGRVKIPRWLTNYTGKKLDFDVVAGLDQLPRHMNEYALVIQCGGCVITNKQLVNRLKPAVDAGVPVTNYGMTIAFLQGVYDRAIAPFLKGRDVDENYL